MISVVLVAYVDTRKNPIKLIMPHWGFLGQSLRGNRKVFFLISCDNKIEYVSFNSIIERVIYK